MPKETTMHKKHLQHNGESDFDHPLDSCNKVNPPAPGLSTMPQSPQQPEGAAAADGFKSGDGIQLLGALWPSQDRVHLISAAARHTVTFRNMPVNAVSDAVRKALALSDAGADAYFACVE